MLLFIGKQNRCVWPQSSFSPSLQYLPVLLCGFSWALKFHFIKNTHEPIKWTSETSTFTASLCCDHFYPLFAHSLWISPTEMNIAQLKRPLNVHVVHCGLHTVFSRGADSREETLITENPTVYPLSAVPLETWRWGEERKGEEDVRTSSNCLQFRPLGHGGRHQ